MTDELPVYDVVIATRNRPDALSLTLPLILAQDPAPQTVIIVDASDDPRAVSAVVDTLSPTHERKVTLIGSPAGSSLQRNRGVREVQAPIVFFPDDDALWHPSFARHVLDVYAQDTSERVAGVGGVEVPEMPPAASEPTYERDVAARWNLRLMPLRYAFEQRVFVEPLNLAARDLMRDQPLPAFVDGQDVVAVEHVTGFRMSYRSGFVRAAGGFDEELGGYGLAEDADMSLRAWEGHILLASHLARVKHHKRPGGRETGRRDGYFHVVNNVYVVAKHAPAGSRARRRMMPWALYRCATYAARAVDPPRRERLRGAIASVRVVRQIAASQTHAELLAIYRQAVAAAGSL